MAIPLAAAMIPSLAQAGYKFFTGNKQAKKGYDLQAGNIRPIYQRPGESVEALNIAERTFRNGAPGMSLQEDRIGRNAAASNDAVIRTAGSSADVLDGITKVNANTNDATNALAAEEQRLKEVARRNYMDQLGVQAGYTDKEFSYNQDMPYRETEAKAASLINAGERNKYSGINDFGGAATSALLSLTDNDNSEGNRDLTGPLQSNMAPVNNISGVANPATSGKLVFDPSTGRLVRTFI